MKLIHIDKIKEQIPNFVSSAIEVVYCRNDGYGNKREQRIYNLDGGLISIDFCNDKPLMGLDLEANYVKYSEVIQVERLVKVYERKTQDTIILAIEGLNSKLQALIESCVGYSAISWEQVYDELFSKGGIASRIRNLNVKLDYYDPDCGYEDDVRAYANALNDYLKSIKQ